MRNILVLCTGNSCRSQIAHGYLDHFSKGRFKVYSAGIEVHGLNPLAIATMAEDQIDISDNTSNHIDEYLDISFDYILTVCDHANENCPYIPGDAIRLHRNFFDPSKVKGSNEEIKLAFRRTRDEIKQWVIDFYKSYTD